MKNKKHTPGPWKSQKTETGGFWVNHEGFAGFSICHLIGQPEMEANARLIAAAPELLAACKMLVFYYHQTRSKFKLAEGYPDPSAFIENLDRYIPYLEAAIAKAEGD